MALDVNNKMFVIHVAIQEEEKMLMHLKKLAQIQDKAQVRALLFDKATIEIPAEYSNYSSIFLAENAAKLLKNTGINEHAIKLEKGKQPSIGLIYSMGLGGLEILKTYIKTNLANSFIRPFKSPASAHILFDQKQDESFCFCVDY